MSTEYLGWGEHGVPGMGWARSTWDGVSTGDGVSTEYFGWMGTEFLGWSAKDGVSTEYQGWREHGVPKMA